MTHGLIPCPIPVLTKLQGSAPVHRRVEISIRPSPRSDGSPLDPRTMRGNYHPSGSGGGGDGGGGKRWKVKGVTGIQLRWPLGTSLEDSSAALLCHLKKIGWCPRPPPRRCSPRPYRFRLCLSLLRLLMLQSASSRHCCRRDTFSPSCAATVRATKLLPVLPPHATPSTPPRTLPWRTTVRPSSSIARTCGSTFQTGSLGRVV